MTIGLILTVIFLILDLTNQIDWAWWQIVLPLFIEIGLSIIVFTLFLAGALATGRKR